MTTTPSTAKRTEYGPSDIAPDFPLGTRVAINGVSYTRISRLGHADWITDAGQERYRLPAGALSVLREPDTDDLEAAFAATPVLRDGRAGFGVVGAHELLPGDVVFNECFRMVTGTVEKTEVVSDAGHVAVTTIVGRNYISAPVVCVYRGGDLGSYFTGVADHFPKAPAQPATPEQVAAFVGNPYAPANTVLGTLNRGAVKSIPESVAVAAAQNPAVPVLLRRLAGHPVARVRAAVLAAPGRTAGAVQKVARVSEKLAKAGTDAGVNAALASRARADLAGIAARKKANKP